MCYNRGVRIIDCGCDDLAAAARNRRRIKSGENLTWWLWYEAVVKSWPLRKPLPFWLPQGELPKVGKHEAKELREHGIYELDNYNGE